MAISLQADSTLPQGYILVDGQRAATISTTALSATLAANTVTTSALVSGAVTTEKIAPGAVVTEDLADGAVTAAKMSGGQSGSAPIYGCRAWVCFDVTRNSSGGSDTNNTNRYILQSGNVLSALKTGTGNYTITFNIPMPDTNYCVIATESTNVGAVNPGNALIAYEFDTTTRTVSTVRIACGDNQVDQFYDPTYMNVVVFR